MDLHGDVRCERSELSDERSAGSTEGCDGNCKDAEFASAQLEVFSADCSITADRSLAVRFR